jgi:hypothetical protein
MNEVSGKRWGRRKRGGIDEFDEHAPITISQFHGSKTVLRASIRNKFKNAYI